MSKCVVCGVGEAVVPDRKRPLDRLKKVCRLCHGVRLLQDLEEISDLVERRRRDWERR